MKIRIIIIVIIISILIPFSFFQSKKNVINYTVIGDKREFTNNLNSLNYIDLIKDKIKEEKKLGNYNKDFIYYDARVTDIINIINNNEKINGKYIQNVLHNTNLLLINIGDEELTYKISNLDEYDASNNEVYDYLDELYNDINNLLKTIKKYSTAKIIFIGYYNNTNNIMNDKYYLYLNNKIKRDKNVLYIDTFNKLSKKNSNYLLDYNENMYIYRKIIDKITCKKII